MFVLHLKPQSQRGRLQPLPARHYRLVVAQVVGIGQVAVDEPAELRGGPRPARRTVHVHPLAQLVAGTSSADFGPLIRQGCSRGGERKEFVDLLILVWIAFHWKWRPLIAIMIRVESEEEGEDTHRQQSYRRDRRRSGRRAPLPTLRNGTVQWLLGRHS